MVAPASFRQPGAFGRAGFPCGHIDESLTPGLLSPWPIARLVSLEAPHDVSPVSARKPARAEILRGVRSASRNGVCLLWSLESSRAEVLWRLRSRVSFGGAGEVRIARVLHAQAPRRAPETWARRAYRNLIYFHDVDKGGHFAAWQQPELFSAELRAAFKSLR